MKKIIFIFLVGLLFIPMANALPSTFDFDKEQKIEKLITVNDYVGTSVEQSVDFTIVITNEIQKILVDQNTGIATLINKVVVYDLTRPPHNKLIIRTNPFSDSNRIRS